MHLITWQYRYFHFPLYFLTSLMSFYNFLYYILSTFYSLNRYHALLSHMDIKFATSFFTCNLTRQWKTKRQWICKSIMSNFKKKVSGKFIHLITQITQCFYMFAVAFLTYFHRSLKEDIVRGYWKLTNVWQDGWKS